MDTLEMSRGESAASGVLVPCSRKVPGLSTGAPPGSGLHEGNVGGECSLSS